MGWVRGGCVRLTGVWEEEEAEDEEDEADVS